ncbi:MAG: hypothetical protein JWL95_1612 [Gemmatimonadetes bacterium]|nr:hypothetical protein [Gemmatimonadota bacterium]
MRTVQIFRACRTAAALAVGAALAACSRSENKTADSSAGNVAENAAASATILDTGMDNAATPVAGGTAQITATDEKSVELAMKYKLTDTNFRQFVAASDSLAALRARDPQVRALFDKQVNDAGTDTRVSTNNAGRKRMQANPAVNNAIAAAGMSVKDYFVAAIAVAQAERFMGNPKKAPPTATLPENAEFLRAHQAELAALRKLEGTAAVP